MIQIDEIKTLPDLDYTDWAQKELMVAAAHTPLWSWEMWLVKSDTPLFVCGVYQPDLLTTPEFWVLMCRDGEKRPVLTTRTAIKALPLLLQRYPRLTVSTPVDVARHRRLIEIAGFRLKTEKNGLAIYEV